MKIAFVNLAVKTLIACCVIFMSPADSWAQACPNPPHISYPGVQNAEIFMTKYDQQGQVVCEVTDRGYIRENIPYRIHFKATSSGGCQLRATGYWPPYCGNLWYEYRYLGTTNVSAGGVNQGNIAPSNFSSIQSIDTRVPTGTASTGLNFQTTTLGEHSLTSTTPIAATACGLSPTSVAGGPFRVNVMKCEPKFSSDNGHMDADEIDVNLASDSPYSNGLDSAIAEWNANAPPGVTFTRVYSACTGDPSHCITVTPDSVVPMNACGHAQASVGAGGVVSGNAVLKVNTTKNFSTSGQKRTFIHELGHFLGMDNYAAACNANDAAMQPSFDCEQTVMDDVTVNDSLPPANSVYGPNTKATCGW